MSGYYDAFDEFMGAWEDDYSPRSKSRKKPKRTVKYVGPGHTRVGYEHRTLDIRFKESQKQFLAKQRSRRRKGARKGASHRSPRRDPNEIFVDFRDGEMVYVDAKGRDVSNRAMSYWDSGTAEITKRDLKKDKYNLEDMRALLKDAHWEEVCGNKRWKYDSKATVREYKKYQKSSKRMR